MTTPKSQGYRMPAEWEPHRATWLSWPHNPDTWPDKMEPVPAYWTLMAKHISTGEEVHININDAQAEAEAKRLLTAAKVPLDRIFFHRFPTNDCWARDHGPIFVTRTKEPKLAVTNWIFNKWGAKYPPWELDNLIPEQIAEHLKVPRFDPGIVMEGGSIEVNGRGTLMTTEACLLNPNRNPHLTKNQIEAFLSDYLGVHHFLWLGDGIVGDDTDGHIDDLTRFVGPDTVVTVVEEDPSDENYKILQDNLKRLRTMKVESGKALNVVELPMPAPVIHEGQRLPASYANFYIANDVVLVPIYSHPNDAKALKTLQGLFPQRKVIGIESTDLVWGLGAFHCVTQQQPAV